MCPGVSASNVNAIVSCLKASVSDYWSGQLNQVVDQDVIVDPSTSQVPSACRSALTAAPAFTCQVNDTVYINQSFLDLVIHEFGTADIPYALASVVSHEIGHVVQAAVKQPGYDEAGTSDAISQRIEQQADCLSGVWAHSQATKNKGFDTKAFQTVSKQLITDISSNPEVATHGTPDQRAAAILRGLSSGTPQGCQLATFS
ncbi:neutral zinc metallopeptidase [Nakamurella panacisegetis]|nr:neutral zinc metallopeptidase [Nakamurella panacisegetis]